MPLFQGCATIASNQEYPVSFENSGGKTYFAVHDQQNQLVHQGMTPEQVTLPAKSAPFRRAKYNVTFAGAGESTQHRELQAGIDPWTAGNIFVGGGLGAIVDGVTGAMFRLPASVTADVPAQYAIADPAQGARIAMLQSSSLKQDDAAPSAVRHVGYQSNSESAR
ncbi:hypothetical protein [Novipirellula maiorica]|uniref:hypothetical protein n=1 Tax=Novipirellula maiorica TaxID=1265734 RepID=UPI001181A709|nr:hypothetical protein [Rhodopirellula maiorica]